MELADLEEEQQHHKEQEKKEQYKGTFDRDLDEIVVFGKLNFLNIRADCVEDCTRLLTLLLSSPGTSKASVTSTLVGLRPKWVLQAAWKVRI